jgi:hypothetical protein
MDMRYRMNIQTEPWRREELSRQPMNGHLPRNLHPTKSWKRMWQSRLPIMDISKGISIQTKPWRWMELTRWPINGHLLMNLHTNQTLERDGAFQAANKRIYMKESTSIPSPADGWSRQGLIMATC